MFIIIIYNLYILLYIIRIIGIIHKQTSVKVKLLPVIITSACFRDGTTAYVAKVQAKSNNNCDPLRENQC